MEESPSSWAEWVEMLLSTTISFVLSGLRPRGRSGLKFDLIGASEGGRESPSSWAEWVEINVHCSVKNPLFSLRPRGRSGLKFYEDQNAKGETSVSVLVGGVG